MIALLLPFSFILGGVRLNPSRFFLLLCAVPFGLRLFGGQLGGFTWVDRNILVFSLLIVVTLTYHHGASQFPYALSQVVEVFGGYMAGRAMIRSQEDYRRFIRYFLGALAVLLPFGIDEAVHGRMLLIDLFRPFFTVVEEATSATDPEHYRFGLVRARVVFPHPILYGLFCATAFASVVALYHRQPFRRLVYLGLTIAATFCSLSSAPLLSIGMQTGLILWGKITGGAWKLLAGMVAFCFVMLQLFTHRGAVAIFIDTLTIDRQTGWYRMMIWQFGTENVINHPIMGIGLNDWVRPSWMYSSSVDNFWLLMAMRYGVFALVAVLLAFVLHVRFIARVRLVDEETQILRRGYLITLVGQIFILATVYVWDSAAVFVMFFLGAGAFLYTSDLSPAEQTAAPAPPGQRPGPVYSRFPQTAGHRARPAADPPDRSPRRAASARSRRPEPE